MATKTASPSLENEAVSIVDLYSASVQARKAKKKFEVTVEDIKPVIDEIASTIDGHIDTSAARKVCAAKLRKKVPYQLVRYVLKKHYADRVA